MPNWCNNDLFIQGDKQSINKLKEELFVMNNGKLGLTFNKIVPMPNGYIESGEWYDWSISNWGTKWDADTYVVEISEEEIYSSFSTAWEPPISFLYALSKKYPELKIQCYFVEEGMEICGTFYSDENGANVVEEEAVYRDEYGEELILEIINDEYVYKYKESGEIYNTDDYYPCASHPQMGITIENKFWIEDEDGNVCFDGKTFDSYEEGWDFLYCQFPVLHLQDGTTDDQEDKLDSYFVVNK